MEKKSRACHLVVFLNRLVKLKTPQQWQKQQCSTLSTSWLLFPEFAKGAGLLKSDHSLHSDPITKEIIGFYARNQDKFFQDFAHAMEKLSNYGVMIDGRSGEMR